MTSTINATRSARDFAAGLLTLIVPSSMFASAATSRRRVLTLSGAALASLAMSCAGAHAETINAGNGLAVDLPPGLTTVPGVPSNTAIGIRFRTVPGNTVEPGSLEISVKRYSFWLVVTERFRKEDKIRIDATGIYIAANTLPAGEQEVRLSFRDTAGQSGKVEQTIHIRSPD